VVPSKIGANLSGGLGDLSIICGKGNGADNPALGKLLVGIADSSASNGIGVGCMAFRTIL